MRVRYNFRSQILNDNTSTDIRDGNISESTLISYQDRPRTIKERVVYLR